MSEDVEITISLSQRKWRSLREACRAFSGDRGAASGQIDVSVEEEPDLDLDDREEVMLAGAEMVCDVIASRLHSLLARRGLTG